MRTQGFDTHQQKDRGELHIRSEAVLRAPHIDQHRIRRPRGKGVVAESCRYGWTHGFLVRARHVDLMVATPEPPTPVFRSGPVEPPPSNFNSERDEAADKDSAVSAPKRPLASPPLWASPLPQATRFGRRPK
jgi:hypothetical protein